MKIELSQAPKELVRRAAQHLESIRGTKMGFGTDNARLGNWVWPIYRPDLDEPAYYEFEVIDTRRPRRVLSTPGFIEAMRADLDLYSLSRGIDLRGKARGYLVLSAGDHDFPVPHWSLDRSPISVQLSIQASKKSEKVKKIYKLDALSYVAENKDGKLIGQVGQMPGLIKGLPQDLKEFQGRISSEVAQPRGDHPNDEKGGEIEHIVKKGGVQEKPDYEIHLDGGWEQLKTEYVASFSPFLKQLRRQAKHAWKVESLVSELGEGILAGESHRVALLDHKVSINLSGEAADYVEAKILGEDGQSRPPAVELRVKDTTFSKEMTFKMNILYADGRREKLLFFVVSRNTPSREKTEIEE